MKEDFTFDVNGTSTFIYTISMSESYIPEPSSASACGVVRRCLVGYSHRRVSGIDLRSKCMNGNTTFSDGTSFRFNLCSIFISWKRKGEGSCENDTMQVHLYVVIMRRVYKEYKEKAGTKFNNVEMGTLWGKVQMRISFTTVNLPAPYHETIWQGFEASSKVARRSKRITT